MNELKQDLTRFLDFAVKHLNLDPKFWTIEVEQDNIVLQTDNAIQADMLEVFLARSSLLDNEFGLLVEPDQVMSWYVKREETGGVCRVS